MTRRRLSEAQSKTYTVFGLKQNVFSGPEPASNHHVMESCFENSPLCFCLTDPSKITQLHCDPSKRDSVFCNSVCLATGWDQAACNWRPKRRHLRIVRFRRVFHRVGRGGRGHGAVRFRRAWNHRAYVNNHHCLVSGCHGHPRKGPFAIHITSIIQGV